MATKKKTSAALPLPFNKKNAEAFGQMVYSDAGGVISCLKLCNGMLQNGKDGGRTTHCAVGEAYHTFVNPSLESILRQKTHDDTDLAIEKLVGVATLKDKSEAGKKKLGIALRACVSSNDETFGKLAENYLERSRDVAETWTKRVLPLLK